MKRIDACVGGLPTASSLVCNNAEVPHIAVPWLDVGKKELTGNKISAEEILREHRESIDRLDAILIYTLGERFKHTQAVGRLKTLHNLPTSDPTRESRQIDRLQKLAANADLDPEFATALINFVIREVIRHHLKQREQTVIPTNSQDKE